MGNCFRCGGLNRKLRKDSTGSDNILPEGYVPEGFVEEEDDLSSPPENSSYSRKIQALL